MKNTTLFALISLTGFLFSFCKNASPEGGETNPTFSNKLENRTDSLVHEFAENWVADSTKVGLSVGVFHKGEIRKYHYGTTEPGKENLPTDETIYEIGSITKTLTGGLAAKAVTDGKMELTDDIRKFLKEEYSNLEYEGNFISIRDLLCDFKISHFTYLLIFKYLPLYTLKMRI